MVKYQHDPPQKKNNTSLHGNTCFGSLGAAIWNAVRTCARGEESRWNIKRNLKKSQDTYISPHRPDDPRRVSNVKLYPLRQTPEIVNPTNFQFDRPNSVGWLHGVLSWLVVSRLISERLLRPAPRIVIQESCQLLLFRRNTLLKFYVVNVVFNPMQPWLQMTHFWWKSGQRSGTAWPPPQYR